MTTNTKILLTHAEAASLCGISEKSFRTQMKLAGIEPVALAPRTVRWRASDVQRWAASLTGIGQRPEPEQLRAGKLRARAAQLGEQRIGAR
ncbi:hypothetical protein FBR04_07505 [Betaproteobacteria bacterium PRO7]|jgi:predicted DNA-binding transcriptional regulator AlpA|nr:hypothetical protein [Betaproteobacteria bacterium PRO7]